MYYIHTMEYDTARKRSEILIYTTTWTNLENIVLSEITQTQKDKPEQLIYSSTYMRSLE